ncbi:hypothetical protein ACFWN1_31910 [Streptomyces sp. NPDC058459]|uniref:hypothetical protein n=1 Tax=Streptomyces sp. NPDC058459 TaxID=3346508 RepID=UPI003664FED8
MTKRLALAVCTVVAAFAAALTGTAATAPADGGTTRITAGGPTVTAHMVAHGATTGGGSDRPKPPTDTSWGG